VTLKLQHHGQLELVNGCHVMNGDPSVHHGFVFRSDSAGNGETFKLIQVSSERGCALSVTRGFVNFYSAGVVTRDRRIDWLQTLDFRLINFVLSDPAILFYIGKEKNT
jgi:hypothetical protein